MRCVAYADKNQGIKGVRQADASLARIADVIETADHPNRPRRVEPAAKR